MTDSYESCLRRIKEAWNAGDARAYANEFAEDATYVTFLGVLMLGRAEIEAAHKDVFTRWRPGEKMAVNPLRACYLSDVVVSVLTVGGLGHNEPIRFDKFQTYIFALKHGRCLCAAFQNTKMSLDAESSQNGP